MSFSGFNDQELQGFHQYIKTQESPFKDIAVGDVWAEIIDVPKINQEISNNIYETVKYVQEKKINQSILILGEPGSGKTHLLARFQRHAEETHKFLFVYIKPIGDIAKINQHILRELIISLLKRLKDRPLSPLFQFITIIVRDTLIELYKKNKLLPQFKPLYDSAIKPKNSAEDYYDFLIKTNPDILKTLFENIIHFISDESPQIDATFLKVLFHLFNPKLQEWAQDWLKCVDLSEDNLLQLKVNYSLDSEDQAEKVLQSIFILARGPILLCFDQMESIYERFQEESGIQFLFDHLMTFYNTFKNLIVIIMCNTQYWSEKIEPEISQSAKQRINPICHLKKLSKEEALELVSKRMELFWSHYQNKKPLKPIFPFSEDYIYYVTQKSGWNPRGLLQGLDEEFKNIKIESVLSEIHAPEEIPTEKSIEVDIKTEEEIKTNIIKQIFEDLSKNYINTLNNISPPECEDELVGFFADFIKECQRNNWDLFGCKNIKYTSNIKQKISQKPISFLLELEKKSEKNLSLELKNLIFLTLITNTTNGPSLASFLKRIKDYLNQNSTWTGIIIRNEDLKIEGRFPASINIINEMKNRIKVIYISKNAFLLILTLKKMLEKASGGELQKDNYLINRKEVLQFIYKIFLENKYVFEEFPGLIDFKPEEEKKSNNIKEKFVLIIQKIQNILYQKKIVNAKTLTIDLKEDFNLIEQACQTMENQGLISILAVHAEEGFLIVSKPKKSAF